ncbi:MAG: YceI family protein [Pseudomonadota bacterium]
MLNPVLNRQPNRPRSITRSRDALPASRQPASRNRFRAARPQLLLVGALLAGCVSDRKLETVLADARYTEAALQYELDRDSTRIGFSVGDTSGRFRVVDARLSFTEPELSAAVLEVTIATASLDLFNPLLEQMLRGADWFDTTAHPSARFQSESVGTAGEQSLAVTGTLTIKNITQPLEISVEFPELPALPDLTLPPERIRFVASGEFLRSTFGMDDLQSFAPDEVQLEIDGTLQRVLPQR